MIFSGELLQNNHRSLFHEVAYRIYGPNSHLIDDKEQNNKGTNDIKVIVVVRTPTSYAVKS